MISSRCRKTLWGHVKGQVGNLNGETDWDGVGTQKAKAKARIGPGE